MRQRSGEAHDKEVPSILREISLDGLTRIDIALEGDWSSTVVTVWTRTGGLAGFSEVVLTHSTFKPSLELYFDNTWFGIHCFRRKEDLNEFDEGLARRIVDYVESAVRDSAVTKKADQATSDHARDLHRRAVVIDGHSDILIPVTEGKMALGERVEVPGLDWRPPPGLDKSPLVQFGLGPHTAWFGCMGQYDLPRWKEGGITAQLCAVYLDDDWLRAPFRRGMEMVWNLHDQIAQHDDLVLATTVREIRQAKQKGQVALVLTFEGCEALADEPRFLDLYYELGLRAASLTHTRRNLYADGCWAADKQGGLTALGRRVVESLRRLRIVIDLVHIGEVGFWEVLELFEGPMILSHTTPTMFPDTSPEARDLAGGKLPRPRLELPRDRKILEAIAESGGVVGLIHVTQRDLMSVVRDIETALDVMGPDHIGLGSDYFGLELAPAGLEDISKVPRLTDTLADRGHSDEVILKYLGGNYLRVFEEIWGE